MLCVEYEVVILGASLGGVAAALAAAREGATVCLVEDSRWVGGQYTYQGVCKADDKEFVEDCGSTASYRAFREAVRRHYRDNFRLSALGVGQLYFNPGGLGDRRFSLDPRLGDLVLKQMLAEDPRIHLRLGQTLTGVEMAGDRVKAINVQTRLKEQVRYQAEVFLDASELGELLPRCGVEGEDWTLGAESKDLYDEPDAPAEARRDWLQPITVPFPLEYRPGGDFTIKKPPGYVAERYSIVDGGIQRMFSPDPAEETMFTYRRFLQASLFDDPSMSCDQTMINCDSNDYKGGILPGEGSADAARMLSLGYCHWLQTECPRHDTVDLRGYPELRLMVELFPTSPKPYVRESRRILATGTVRQQDVDSECQPGARALFCADSVGIGMYPIDVHRHTGVGMPGLYKPTRPFQIPLCALLPRRWDNLLPACKNLGVTHITNGCYRLHPVEWNIGEAAGTLAALSRGRRARDVAPRELQTQLLKAGVPLYWWTDVPSSDPLFEASQLLALDGRLALPELTLQPSMSVTASLRGDAPEFLQTRREWVAWLAGSHSG